MKFPWKSQEGKIVYLPSGSVIIPWGNPTLAHNFAKCWRVFDYQISVTVELSRKV